MFGGLKADPEQVQQQFIAACDRLDRNADKHWGQWALRRLWQQLALEDTALAQTLWGLSFPNPIGLAAGFDKNGVASNVWPAFGFGFAELGTVTWHAQTGNPTPRLFRLPEDQAAINRMGFNNQGATQMAQVLAASRQKATALKAAGLYPIPIGVNLGKSKITVLEAAAKDYRQSFEQLQAYADYLVVNVSSPNTPGLRSLQSVSQLEPILATLQQVNTAAKPLFLKIAPDLAQADIVSIVDLAQQHQLAGIIATNTTLQRDSLKTRQIRQTGLPPEAEAGGLSGAPVRDRATEIVQLIYQHTQGQLPIIGVGGVFTPQDAWEKLAAGASLVQVYTGWTYEGPWMVRRILSGLLQSLKAHGLEQIHDVVGSGLAYRQR